MIFLLSAYTIHVHVCTLADRSIVYSSPELTMSFSDAPCNNTVREIFHVNGQVRKLGKSEYIHVYTQTIVVHTASHLTIILQYRRGWTSIP